MAITVNLCVDQGTTIIENFQVNVLTFPTLPFNASTNPYIPLNLTGASFNMMVRPTYDTPVVLTASSSNGKIVCTAPTTGAFSLVLAPADTTNIKFTGDSADYVYDCEITDAGGNVIRPFQGAFSISREATR